jgi:hypothetical protein
MSVDHSFDDTLIQISPSQNKIRYVNSKVMPTSRKKEQQGSKKNNKLLSSYQNRGRFLERLNNEDSERKLLYQAL